MQSAAFSDSLFMIQSYHINTIKVNKKNVNKKYFVVNIHEDFHEHKNHPKTVERGEDTRIETW